MNITMLFSIILFSDRAQLQIKLWLNRYTNGLQCIAFTSPCYPYLHSNSLLTYSKTIFLLFTIARIILIALLVVNTKVASTLYKLALKSFFKFYYIFCAENWGPYNAGKLELRKKHFYFGLLTFSFFNFPKFLIL